LSPPQPSLHKIQSQNFNNSLFNYNKFHLHKLSQSLERKRKRELPSLRDSDLMWVLHGLRGGRWSAGGATGGERREEPRDLSSLIFDLKSRFCYRVADSDSRRCSWMRARGRQRWRSRIFWGERL